MDEINKEIIPYFERCLKIHNRKGVGIITDKQNVFFEEADSFFTHDVKACELTQEIFPGYEAYKYDKECVYYFCDGYSIVFYLPYDLSFNQYSYLMDLLEKIYNYNKNSIRKIEIVAINNEKRVDINENTSIDSMKEQLSSIKERSACCFHRDNEIIIGEQLPDNVVIDNIYDMSSINKCINGSDLEESFGILLSMYRHQYYKKYIDMIFPDFSIFTELIAFNWRDINNEIEERLKSVSDNSSLFQLLLYCVSYSLRKKIYSNEKAVRLYESFHDLDYQSDLINYRKQIEDDRNLLKKMEDAMMYHSEVGLMLEGNNKDTTSLESLVKG